MNKKLLTKFVVVLAIVVSIFLGTYNVLTPNYDSNILNDAKTFTTSTDFSDLTTNPFLNTSRYFDVVEMEKKNATAEKELDDSVDLTAIYNKATKQLGMVAASENQMDTYESRKSTQVRTHGDIPAE